MLYVSTGGIKNKTAVETAIDFSEAGIFDIELSGGQHSPTYKEDLMKLSENMNFQVHNYFPPPKKPFVFNLASDNEALRKKSIEHVINSINLALDLDCNCYSFHAGFRINPKIDELGNNIKKTTLCDRKISIDNFGESMLFLSEVARKKGVDLFIENNVLNKRNFEAFGEDPLLLTEPDEIEKFLNMMPNNIGLLMDVAHLKVSANTLGFDMFKGHEKLKKYIKGYHLSDNDGEKDSNEIISEKSWFWPIIDKDKDYYSIEIYNIKPSELKEQYNLAKEILSKNI